MSHSVPRRTVKPFRLRFSSRTRSRRSRACSAVSPRATVAETEWSEIPTNAYPRRRAASTIASSGSEPSVAFEAARRRGYAFVGISDHSVSATVARGLTAEQALSRRDRVRALNRELKGFTVLLGTECDILDGGEMDYPDEVLKELDFVIASVHSRFTLPQKTQTARIVAAVQNPHV